MKMCRYLIVSIYIQIFEAKKQIAGSYHKKQDKLTIGENSTAREDCGLYAIAIDTDLCHAIDPVGLLYAAWWKAT